MAPITGELDVSRVLAGHGPQRMGDFECLFIDQVYGVVVGAEEDVGPGVWRVAVAAHEEAGPFGGYFLDQFPGMQIEYGNESLADVRRSEERRVGKECGSTCRSRGWPDH